jgi:hypothetical protein
VDRSFQEPPVLNEQRIVEAPLGAELLDLRAVAPGGSMISAGSPVRNVRKNETTETPRMTRTAVARRPAM